MLFFLMNINDIDDNMKKYLYNIIKLYIYVNTL